MTPPGRILPPVRIARPKSVVDLVVGLALTTLGLYQLAMLDTEGGVIGVLTIPLVTLPVIWRRRAPLRVAMAVSLGVVVSAIPTFDQTRCGVALPSMLLVLYAVGSRCDRRAAVRGLGILLAALVYLDQTDPQIGPLAGTIVLFFPLYAGIWGAGLLVASRRRTAATLRERTEELEDQRAQTAQLAVEIERTRLTSELDGAVRERLGEIVQLAGEGERAPAVDADASRQAFARIEAAGRTSLDEMRGLLGALRSDEPAPRAPRPTLAELDVLLAGARAGGRVVELDVSGERRPLPAGIELAAYRIVEHALTAISGDGRDAISVGLRFAADSLEVEVEGACPQAGVVEDRPIAAAREQAAARGGSFSVRPAGADRTTFRARLPLVAEHA
jgi:signal transduction histidine kinase